MRMRKLWKCEMDKCGFIIAFLVICCAETTRTADPCGYWENLAQSISTIYGNTSNILHMSCIDPNKAKNHCAQLHCTGSFQYRTWYPSNPVIEMDFCFGIIFNHCDKPNPSMDYYLLVPKKNVSFSQRIHHNGIYQVNGLTYSILELGRADVFLYFEMKKINATTLKFGVKSKVKITSVLNVEWPDDLQLNLLPEQTVPVPSCQNISTEISPTPEPMSSCTVKPQTNQQPVVVTPKSPTFNQTCDSGKMLKQCGMGEICHPVTGEDKERCGCKFFYFLSPASGYCEGLKSTVTVSTQPSTEIPSPHSDSSSSKSNDNNYTIVGIAVAAVLLLMLVVVTVIVIIRKRRAHTFRHSLLADTDDTEVIM